MSSGSDGPRHRPQPTGAKLAGSAALLAVIGLAALAHRGGPMAPVAGAEDTGSASTDVLRVCADPNNLPFSNRGREGFENALADLIAEDFGWRVSYVWWPQRRGFIRSTLAAGACDVVMGLPSSFQLALTTRPYYRSTYVFVSRRDLTPRVQSFDDPRLRRLRIGVPLVGDDYANTPPAEALSQRGIVANVHGYSVLGDYTRADPPAALIRAVSTDDIDVAVAWGPLAGYFAPRQATPLVVVPIADTGSPTVRYAFDISMGVRPGNAGLRSRLDDFIARRQADVDRLLQAYGVPRLEVPAAGT